jgi:hypothetical protein
MTDDCQPMTEDMLRETLEAAGAKTMSRSGRNEHYGSPREYSFEVRAVFPNKLGLQITARQYNYRDPWETSGRVNDLVDVALLYQNRYSELPKGYPYFKNKDSEEGVDYASLQEIISAVKNINPKLFTLQELTGDL